MGNPQPSQSLARGPMFGGQSAPEIRALYLHIPFCHSICPFCAFAVHGNRERLHERFVERLLADLDLADPWPAPGDIQSIYVGGGTPSTLAPARIETVLRRIADRFSPALGVEIAFEVNPEDATGAYLAALRGLGITRISLGVQSLDDATLRALGRGHTAAQAAQAFDAAVRAGFDNVNVDLMFGAPGMEVLPFREDVRRLLAWQPAHISLYGLDLEPRTLFGRNARIQAWCASHREEQAAQFLWAAEALDAAGYEHYEVSNFCLPGREGRQNQLVWNGAAYLGFGPGAHSFAEGRRWAHERHLAAYEARLFRGERAIAFSERPTREQAANEALMLALRQRTGLHVTEWEGRFGLNWGLRRAEVEGELVRRGLAVREAGRLRLNVRGMLVADEITERLLVETPDATGAARP